MSRTFEEASRQIQASLQKHLENAKDFSESEDSDDDPFYVNPYQDVSDNEDSENQTVAAYMSFLAFLFKRIFVLFIGLVNFN